jgi:hypothetical protein
MEASRINVKARNFRGGYTVVRYTITCECGCSEKAFAKAFKSDERLTEEQVTAEIMKLHTEEDTGINEIDSTTTVNKSSKKSEVKAKAEESPDKDS